MSIIQCRFFIVNWPQYQLRSLCSMICAVPFFPLSLYLSLSVCRAFQSHLVDTLHTKRPIAFICFGIFNLKLVLFYHLFFFFHFEIHLKI